MKEQFLKFMPAQLVKGKSRWYIKFRQTNPTTGGRQLFRKTFDLNRIENKNQRLKKAREIINELNNVLLPLGYPFDDVTNLSKLTTIEKALNKALEIKCKNKRRTTIHSYESIHRIFTQWLKKKNFDKLNISDFKRRHAIAFMDYVLFERDVCNTTFNNYLRDLRGLFSELRRREYISNNCFEEVPYLPKTPKKRRNFTPEEVKIVLGAIKSNPDNYWLFRGVLLQYYGFIRPVEMRRLRFSDFDLKRGTIYLSGQKTKSKKERTVTIPTSVLHYFQDETFTSYPSHYFVFGKGFFPDPHKSCGHETMNRLQKRILLKLYKEGILDNIEGLSWYSWKDTGITDSTDHLNIKDVQAQAGHHSLEETMKYIHAHKVNKGMRNYTGQVE